MGRDNEKGTLVKKKKKNTTKKLADPCVLFYRNSYPSSHNEDIVHHLYHAGFQMGVRVFSSKAFSSLCLFVCLPCEVVTTELRRHYIGMHDD